MDDNFLANLNASQHAAVSSVADTLAILAGPGSGKTHTLTSRTAWLLRQGLQPWNIVVATFTVKAAREMKERIGQLVGNGLESKLILGTFHSIARRYLTRYGHLINIPKDFGIADSGDSLAIVKRIVKRHNFVIDPKVARSRISSRKARGNEDTHGRNHTGPQSVEKQEFEQCFTEYEEALARSNLLDYDDLLLRCVTLLRSHPSCVSNVEAVLIDEFQDTNIVQFDLMRLFAFARKRITIVGDPDQSIYGFRAAEIKNYKRLLHQYPDTVTIPLEENYRSSGAILLSALSVIEQDTGRIAKSLTPTHVVGTRPVLRKLSTAQMEAEWLVTELRRCTSLTGDVLGMDDFAILLRSASLSRHIESALGKAGIPYRIVGGLRFYDRLEVKTLLDYLRVINQPDNNDALARIINTPSRRIGELTIKSLIEEADRASVTLWTLILDTIQGRRVAKTKLTKPTEQGLSSFVNIIITARKKIADSATTSGLIVDLVDHVLKKTNFEEWLETQHGDDATKARWANVQELIAQASDFQNQILSGFEEDALPQIDGLEQDDSVNPLSMFLANVALASDVGKEQDGEKPAASVTISTIHAAKGLEWPVVFIPAVYQGSIPHSRADDTDEERRLLYVAMTRAQSLLYLSYPLKNSQGEQTTLSPFVSSPSLSTLLDVRGPSLTASAVQSICQILRRPLPSAQAIESSSSSLLSRADDLFPIGNEQTDEGKSRWDEADGRPSFTKGQRPPKRQRIELGVSSGNADSRQHNNWRGDYNTTMGSASTFTIASTTLEPGFVSAGTHLLRVGNQTPTNEASTKPTINRRDGQDTILTFFGKPNNSRREARISHSGDTNKPNKSSMLPDIRPVATADKSIGPTGIPQNFSKSQPHNISPTLANHRLSSTLPSCQPRKITLADQQEKRKAYVFLSSSPPRAAISEEVDENKPAGTDINAGPSILPHTRPATTMHTTSVSLLNQSVPQRRTLGVKRSMNGWSNRKSQAFVPPTMKRPP